MTTAPLLLAIGMEATYGANASLTHATAALSDGTTGFNAATGHPFQLDRFDDLVESGHATKLPQAIPLRDAPTNGGATVVRISDTAFDIELLREELPASDLLHGGFLYVVFPTREAFLAWSKGRVRALATAARALHPHTSEHAVLVRHGLILAPGDGELNALRVMEMPEERRTIAAGIARAMVRTDEERAVFQASLKALKVELPDAPSASTSKGKKGGRR